MPRISTVMSTPRASSSVAGAPVSNAVRTTVSSSPSSENRRPSAFAWTPSRCRVDTALGDVYSTLPEESRTMAPSPTRGASSLSASSASKGNAPLAIMRAKRLNTST